MSLNKSTISTAIKTVLNTNAGNENRTTQQTADELAEAIINAIKSLQITIPVGAIAVQGSASAQANTVPIVLTSAVS